MRASLYNNPYFATGMSSVLDGFLGGDPAKIAQAEMLAARAGLDNQTAQYRTQIGEAGDAGDLGTMLIRSLQAGNDFSAAAPEIASAWASIPGSGYTQAQQDQIQTGTGVQTAGGTMGGLAQTLDAAYERADLPYQWDEKRRRAGQGVYESALGSALIGNESDGDWTATNDAVGSGGKVGHFGRGQFGQARLEDAKRAGILPSYVTPGMFAANTPQARMWQQATEVWHRDDILANAASSGITNMIGSTFMGIPVTQQGIINVAHLGGVKGMTDFFASGGKYNPADINGTRLSDYLRLGAQDAPNPMRPVHDLLVAAGNPDMSEGQAATLADLAGVLLEDQLADPEAIDPIELGVNERLVNRDGSVLVDAIPEADADADPADVPALSASGRATVLNALGDDVDPAVGMTVVQQIEALLGPGMSENAAIAYGVNNLERGPDTTKDSWWPFDEKTVPGPIIGIRPPLQPAADPAASVGQQQGGLPQPKTEAELAALPSGTKFIAPNGAIKVKP
jgi:hypothetical protein